MGSFADENIHAPSSPINITHTHSTRSVTTPAVSVRKYIRSVSKQASGLSLMTNPTLVEFVTFDAVDHSRNDAQNYRDDQLRDLEVDAHLVCDPGCP
jgi:hypothetical protein